MRKFVIGAMLIANAATFAMNNRSEIFAFDRGLIAFNRALSLLSSQTLEQIHREILSNIPEGDLKRINETIDTEDENETFGEMKACAGRFVQWHAAMDLEMIKRLSLVKNMKGVLMELAGHVDKPIDNSHWYLYGVSQLELEAMPVDNAAIYCFIIEASHKHNLSDTLVETLLVDRSLTPELKKFLEDTEYEIQALSDTFERLKISENPDYRIMAKNRLRGIDNDLEKYKTEVKGQLKDAAPEIQDRIDDLNVEIGSVEYKLGWLQTASDSTLDLTQIEKCQAESAKLEEDLRAAKAELEDRKRKILEAYRQRLPQYPRFKSKIMIEFNQGKE